MPWRWSAAKRRPARAASQHVRAQRGDHQEEDGARAGRGAHDKGELFLLTQFALRRVSVKMGPGDLSHALAGLPASDDPRLLVGHGTYDDAGVFRLSDTVALVQTVDFFAPIMMKPMPIVVVARVNALSDVIGRCGLHRCARTSLPSDKPSAAERAHRHPARRPRRHPHCGGRARRRPHHHR